MVTIGKIDIKKPDKLPKVNEDALPLIAMRDTVLFPGVSYPVRLGRQISIDAARRAEAEGHAIGILCQTDSSVDSPVLPGDFYDCGVVAQVLKVIELPGAPITMIVRTGDKFSVEGVADGFTPSDLIARVKVVRERVPRKPDPEIDAMAQMIKHHAIEIISKTSDGPSELQLNIQDIDDAVTLVNVVCTHIPLAARKKMDMLHTSRIKERAAMLITELENCRQMIELTQQISQRTHQKLSEQQRNAFLQAQMDSIRKELYGDDGPEADVEALRKKAAALAMTDEARATFDRELQKLMRLSPQSPDFAVLQSYLELLTELPWGKEDQLNNDIAKAEDVLEADHYGLEKVKERILEQIALLINAPDGHAPILCLVGPPGVGKTSLGQSIARALGRKYRRVALGGLHDEAEIRGHRRTYIGAMPGRIIDAMRRSGSANPVILLDEIDKIGNDYKGDPSAALLEVLDPEQNCRFHDNYVDVDFDLSKVLFIATANSLSGIPAPLLDRMETIEISGYLPEEKIEIARRHLLPRIMREAALAPELLNVPDDTMLAIIETYTGESGVRQLEKRLASFVRKVVRRKVSGKEWPATLLPEHLTEFLGAAPYIKERYEGNDYAGVVTGLAWTSAGGCVLSVESSLSPGKSGKLTITGNLGDVMKESATLALQHIHANANRLGIDASMFDNNSVHIHVPEGAIPKDGPSAGITMATSLVSAFTGRKVRERVAMTGELTLRGRVLPIGGVKEKILAAKRAGITDVVLPDTNRKDVEEIPAVYLDGLSVHYVHNVDEVFDYALLPK